MSDTTAGCRAFAEEDDVWNDDCASGVSQFGAVFDAYVLGSLISNCGYKSDSFRAMASTSGDSNARCVLNSWKWYMYYPTGGDVPSYMCGRVTETNAPGNTVGAGRWFICNSDYLGNSFYDSVAGKAYQCNRDWISNSTSGCGGGNWRYKWDSWDL